MKHARTVAVAILLVLTGPPLFPQESNWEKSWEEAFARAEAEQKLVLVDFWAGWCMPCRKMDEEVLPAPQTRERLDKFVLVKVNVDQSVLPRRHGVRGVPSFMVFDPWERLRYRIDGARTVEDFNRNLDLILSSAAHVLRAGAMLNTSESTEAYFLLGNGYVRAGALPDARSTYERARKCARKEVRPDLEQIAAVQIAMLWSLEGNDGRALAMLKKISSSPADQNVAANAYYAIGQIQGKSGRRAEAESAYALAMQAAPSESPLRVEAEKALAQLRTSRP